MIAGMEGEEVNFRSGIIGGDHANRRTRDAHDLAAADLASLPQFGLSVDLDLSRGDHGLRLTSAGGNTRCLQQGIERNELAAKFEIDWIWHGRVG